MPITNENTTYKRQAVRRMLPRNWEEARGIIEKIFTAIDYNELKSLQLTTEIQDDKDTILDNIVHCAVTDDFDQVFDDSGELVTLK
jgi:hypothetical protein